jgi:four helix bundle protein
MTLAEACYRLTRQFPRDELFGLTSQIGRAVGSVPANIAEGHGRENTGNFVQSLGKMLRALIRSLQDKSAK